MLFQNIHFDAVRDFIIIFTFSRHLLVTIMMAVKTIFKELYRVVLSCLLLAFSTIITEEYSA